MPSIHDLVLMVATDPTARVIAAVLLFGVMHFLKMVPGVEDKIFTTPRLRVLLNVLMALAPAGYLLADGSVPMLDVITTAVDCALVAMGFHAGSKVLRGQPVGAAPPEPAPPA